MKRTVSLLTAVIAIAAADFGFGQNAETALYLNIHTTHLL